MNSKTGKYFLRINFILPGLGQLHLSGEGPGDEVPQCLVHQGFVLHGTPGPGTDPGPTERTAQGGLRHVVLEAGETEDVAAGHLDRLQEDVETDGADDVPQVHHGASPLG